MMDKKKPPDIFENVSDWPAEVPIYEYLSPLDVYLKQFDAEKLEDALNKAWLSTKH
jgi:hypothetical protein